MAASQATPGAASGAASGEEQPPQGGAAPPPLDDVMLAMDVVDNLRHADRLVERELGSDARDAELKERLRRLYAAQGIEVPERILDEGVAALREDRFVYQPPPAGIGRSLALLWVRRGRMMKIAAVAAGVSAAAGGGWYFGVQLPEERRIAAEHQELAETIPQQARSELERVVAVSEEPAATQEARDLAAAVDVALAADDAPAAREKLSALTDLRKRLEQSYTLRILSRPGEQSGVWRVPRSNPNARNYYILVEAIDAAGRPVELVVHSEEDNKTERANVFGMRVDEQTFDRIRADKQDDGIIENNRFGEKQPGYLKPQFYFPTPGGVILSW
ncbi:MAG: hypothetical protein JNM75_03345 [Rhodospirillales bacterium]|nr:hypothetical protein [Rhodospirillales bacterium]